MPEALPVPDAYREIDLAPARQAWIDTLSARAGELAERWSLATDGEPRFGSLSVVWPVRSAQGRALMLKMHAEAAGTRARRHARPDTRRHAPATRRTSPGHRERPGREPASRDRSCMPLVHGDCHYLNVLHTLPEEPAGWVAINPLPAAGYPEWQLAAPLRNRWADAAASDDPERAQRRRFDILSERAGLDRDLGRGCCR